MVRDTPQSNNLLIQHYSQVPLSVGLERFHCTHIVMYTQVRTALLKMCRREKDGHPQSSTVSGKTDAGSYAFLDVMWSKSSGSLTKFNDMAKLPLEVSACSTFQSALHPCCLGNFVCRFL